MIRHALARTFRSLNTDILYVRLSPVEKLLKISLVLSTWFYKRWKKKARASESVEVLLDRDISMKVDIGKAMGAAFYWMGFHELNEWRFLHRYLKPEMVFADIGANQGEFSLFAAKRLTQGEVLAFEPVTIFYHQLLDNIKSNHFTNIRTYPFGLSDNARKMPIYMGATGAGEHEGLATIFQSDQRKRFIQEIDLRVLDDLVPSLKLSRLDFMKIDVEGAEWMVLKGSKGTLEQYKPLVMLEVNDDTYRTAGYSMNDIRNFFTELGYTMHLIGRGGILTKAERAPAFCNVVFVPDTTKLR